MSKNAIVFGGSGFLGSHVADNLSEHGYNVTLFDIQPSSYIRPDQTMIVGDILNSDKVNNALKNKNVVFHFAGLSDLGKGTDQPLEVVNQNILGTINLLNGAVKNNIKYVKKGHIVAMFRQIVGYMTS